MLPDLLRDLGAPFPAVWAHFVAAHPPRESARHFAKVLAQIESRGLDHVVTRVTEALATGAPLLLTLTTEPVSAPGRLTADAVPAALRDVEVTTGRAADYDGWLAEAI